MGGERERERERKRERKGVEDSHGHVVVEYTGCHGTGGTIWM